MNLKILFLLCFVTILIVPDADAWFGGRRRRRWSPRRIYRTVCSISCKVKGCSYVSSGGAPAVYVCSRVCGRVCKKIFGKKRDEQENPGPIQDEPALQTNPFFDEFIVRLPARLSFYDADKDGRISRAEFMAIHPRKTDKISTAKTFDAVDTNGDHYIDCKEFLNAKLQYEAKPKC